MGESQRDCVRPSPLVPYLPGRPPPLPHYHQATKSNMPLPQQTRGIGAPNAPRIPAIHQPAGPPHGGRCVHCIPWWMTEKRAGHPASNVNTWNRFLAYGDRSPTHGVVHRHEVMPDSLQRVGRSRLATGSL